MYVYMHASARFAGRVRERPTSTHANRAGVALLTRTVFRCTLRNGVHMFWQSWQNGVEL